MSLADLVRALASPAPKPKQTTPAPKPEPAPATGPTESPIGTITLGGSVYRLPRAVDGDQLAHNLALLAECFGTVDEMRQYGVPEERVRLHEPKSAADVAARLAQKRAIQAAQVKPVHIGPAFWPHGSTDVAPGARPVPGSRVHLWDEIHGMCHPAVVQRVADHYAPVGAKLGSPDAYVMLQALNGDSSRWARYNAHPVKLEQLGFADVVWSWHRLLDHPAAL